MLASRSLLPVLIIIARNWWLSELSVFPSTGSATALANLEKVEKRRAISGLGLAIESPLICGWQHELLETW